MSNDKLAEALNSLRLKFTSGNDVPVPEARITRAEWEAIEQAHAAEDAHTPWTNAEREHLKNAAELVAQREVEAAQAAEPVGVLSIEDDDSIPQGKTAVFNYADACLRLPIGYHEIYTHPQPAQDVDAMVARFLAWRLPENFSPDCGISFTPEYNVEYMAKQGKPPMRHEPVGTNLFDADQARAMILHILGDNSTESPQPAQDAKESGR